MPMHDWTKVIDGIYHDFHQAWIQEIKRALNRGLLPPDCYALAEQVAAGFGPDVLTLQDRNSPPNTFGGGTSVMTLPRTKHIVEQARGTGVRRRNRVAVRHVSDDRVLAMIEIVSPGNKNSAHAIRAFVEKTCELLDQHIHLLILDPFPPSQRDPNGIHAAIWEYYTGETFELPVEEPLTFVSYESANAVRGFIETLAVGDTLPNMPLFLSPEFHISLPTEATYQSAWETVPPRWQQVIDSIEG